MKRNSKSKDKDIDSVVEQMQERKNTKEKTDESPELTMPTGIDLLDCVLMGGVPVGKIVNIVGDSSTGKTYLAIESIAFLKRFIQQKSKSKKFPFKKFRWEYDDVESGFSFDTKGMYGFDIIDEESEPSDSVEKFSTKLNKSLENTAKDELLVYVLDSLDGISSEAEIKRDKEMMKKIEKGEKVDGSYQMEKQKFMSGFFRLRSREIKKKNCILIIISQVRENINAGLFSEKYKRSGGKALDFYAHSCLWLSVVEKYIKKGRIIGVCVKVKSKKGKIKRPFRECYLDIIFDYGVDNISSNIKFLYDLKTDKGKDKEKSSKIKWDGKDYTIKGLVNHIEENNLEDELKNKVIEKWNEIEDTIASKRKNKWTN